MDLISTSPFGQRPLTAALLKRAKAAQAPVTVPEINKWALFRDLCTARHNFDITDRDLAVMNALLTFHPDTILSDTQNLIVFPSNRTLSERAHGMAESTLRRHLAALCTAGLILRHDSPNGKRYVARRGDKILRAYGFDLRPLLVRVHEITHAAAKARETTAHVRHLRAEIGVMKRDASKYSIYAQETDTPGDWENTTQELAMLHKNLRRKLCVGALETIRDTLHHLLSRIVEKLETLEMSGSDTRNERHHLNSNIEIYKNSTVPPVPKADTSRTTETGDKEAQIPLSLVLKACPDILPYAKEEIRHWHQLVGLAGFVKGMLGISADTWDDAQKQMGPEKAAATLAAILQRVSEIRTPGAYLRRLTQKTRDSAFSPTPMILALLTQTPHTVDSCQLHRAPAFA